MQLQCLVLGVEFLPNDDRDGRPMRATCIGIGGIILFAEEGEEGGQVEVERAGDVESELGFEDIVVTHELADGDAVFLDEVEVGCETASVRLRGSAKHSAAFHLFFLYVEDTVWLLFRNVENSTVFLLLRDLHKSDKTTLHLFLIFLFLMVVDAFLVFLGPNFMRL